MAKVEKGRLEKLLDNSRFWVLCLGLIVSVIILGLVQQYVPSGSTQTIRLQQAYAFASLITLFLALLVTPAVKLFPGMRYEHFYKHSRRAVGVLSFYYASLHVVLVFFKQLNGFSGIKYLNQKYTISLLVGLVALLILLLMAVTSTDWAVKTLTFKNWKRLHRFVYLAGVLILLHVLLVGTHFINHTVYFYITGECVLLLVIFEIVRIFQSKNKPKSGHKS